MLQMWCFKSFSIFTVFTEKLLIEYKLFTDFCFLHILAASQLQKSSAFFCIIHFVRHKMDFSHKFLVSLVMDKIGTNNCISLLVDFYGICFFFISDNFYGDIGAEKLHKLCSKVP